MEAGSNPPPQKENHWPGIDLEAQAGPRSPSGESTFGIRVGEGWFAWLFFAYFFVLACAQYAVKSVRQAAFIDSWGAEQLPWVYLMLALVSLPVLVLYTRVASRYRLHRTIIVFCAFHGATLAAFYGLFSLPGRLVPILFYVWSTVAFGVAVSQLWSYAGLVFDPRQAKRLFAFVGAGGLLGGIPGGLLAREISVRAGTYVTLLISGSLFFLVAAVVFLIEKRRSYRGEDAITTLEADELREARGGLRTILGSRLLEMIALLMMMTMIAAQMVDLQFNWAIQAVTRDLDHRTAMFGGVFSAMGLVGFIFQLLFTRRIHRGLGVGFSLRVLPVSVAIGTVFLILAIGVLPAAIIGAAWFLKLSEGGLRHSIDQATRELLFLPVHARLRRRGKAFIDIFVQRFAKGAAAVLLLPVSFGLFGMSHVGIMTLGVAALWLVTAEMTRREYVRAFRLGLKAGPAGEPDPVDVGDAGTLATLVEAMGSADPREVVQGIDLLASHGEGRLVPPLLLHHESEVVRRRVIEVLAAEGRRDAVGLIEGAIGDPELQVRSAAISALAALKDQDAASMMEGLLDERDPHLRAEAIAFHLDRGPSPARERAVAVLLEMLSDGRPTVRCEAARALGQVDEATADGRLIQLLYDPEQKVVREAVRAARRQAERDASGPLCVPMLISLMGDRRLKNDAREAIVAHGDRAVDALVLFMNSRDERIWVRRAIPKAMALIGGDRAVAALLAGLEVPDAYLRAKVIESLASLRRGDGGLVVELEAVRLQIHEEARRYLRALIDLVSVSSPRQLHIEGPHPAWGREGRTPTLLQEFLARRMRGGLANLFGLLELLFPPEDIRAASRSLSGGDRALFARALEYLDNCLTGGIRRDVFSVIEDVSIEDKTRRGGQLFSLHAEGPDETMRRLLRLDVDLDPDAVGLVVAAAYGVWVDHIESLLPDIERLTDATDPLVRETARRAVAKMTTTRIPQGRRRVRPMSGEENDLAGEEIDMSGMTRVEMMVFLQGVDLFSFCDADQMLRLASIARERIFDGGETLYRRGEPADALYCVVEGGVRLIWENGREEEVGPRGRFGVGEILSGRMRAVDAAADKKVRVLIIDADDFFDLLSNNIEIVKALFRQLTDAGLEREGKD